LQAKVTVGHQRLLSVSGERENATGGVVTPAHQVGQGHRLHGGGRPVEDDRHVGHGIVYCARASVRALSATKLPISAPQARRSMLATSAGLSGGSVMRSSSRIDLELAQIDQGQPAQLARPGLADLNGLDGLFAALDRA
jgi:hypothetical protein